MMELEQQKQQQQLLQEQLEKPLKNDPYRTQMTREQFAIAITNNDPYT